MVIKSIITRRFIPETTIFSFVSEKDIPEQDKFLIIPNALNP